MKKLIVFIVIAVLVLFTYLYFSQKHAEKARAASDACKISGNLYFVKDYMKRCRKLGFNESCELNKAEEDELLLQRDERVTACIVNTSLSR